MVTPSQGDAGAGARPASAGRAPAPGPPGPSRGPARAGPRAPFGPPPQTLAAPPDGVVFSSAPSSPKPRRNMAAAARSFGLAWEDPEAEWKRALAADLADVAARHGMALRICAQPQYLAGKAEEARCIDAERLSRVAGRTITERGCPFDCACTDDRPAAYRPGMLPATDALLARSMSFSIGVSDPNLAPFGVTIRSDAAATAVTAERFAAAARRHLD